MERLTIKAPSGLIHFSDNKESTMNTAIKKLSDYEDLEEQGKLLKFPCAVGDAVYSATAYSGVCEHEIRKFEFDKNGWHACSNLKFPVNEFGRRVFLTREEAESALIELSR